MKYETFTPGTQIKIKMTGIIKTPVESSTAVSFAAAAIRVVLLELGPTALYNF